MKTLLILFILNVHCYSQTFAFEKERHEFNRALIEQKVVNKIQKKSYDGVYEYEAKYLGEFKTKNGQYYIINSSYIHLKKLYNDNEIFIYNSKKQFLGYYNLASNYQLPTKLINNSLFFKTDNCISKVDLKNGIPRVICIGCPERKDCIEFL